MKSGGYGATMSRILVLMDHKENRRLLAGWLATRYMVLPQETDEALDEEYDLGILDGTALDRLADRIQTRKLYQQTVFLPFLLVTAEQHVELVTKHLWKSIDEVIHSPIDKVELQARMEVLLRARRQAAALRLAGERALRHSEERLGMLIEGVQDYALFLIDPSGHVSGWNTGAKRLLGYEAEEIIGQPISLFFTPEDRQSGKPERELETARTTGRSSDENWLVRKDGSRFWASGLITALQNGSLQGYVKVLRDLSERKQAKEQIARLLGREKQQAARLVQVAAASLTIHSALSVDSVLRVITHEARRILDTHQSVSSMTVNEQWEQAINTISLSDKYAQWRTYDAKPDGSGMYAVVCATNKPLRLTQAELDAHPAWRHFGKEVANHPPLRGWLAAPFVGRDGRNMGLIQLSDKVDGGDFTPDDEAILVQLAYIASVAIENGRLYDGLREADRRKDEFLAMLAHELRNPLAPILNAVQIIQLSSDRATREQARTIMERQLTHMVRLVDDLLDLSRITRDKIELRKERVELATVVQSAIETSRPLIEAAGHELTITLPPEPIHLEADLTRLAQVFSNLLNNAVKYTEPGGHIWVTAERHGGEVVVKVGDTGRGMPAEMLPNIFGMFTQVDRSLERSQGGLGIGLTLVKRLVEMHGGSVQAFSEGLGHGSEFTVRLPLTQEGTPLAVVGPKPETPRKAPPRRILVVDDNTDAAESLAQVLRLNGHEVRTAYDGPTALDVARAQAPEVVLLDIGLPGMNGVEVARRMRQSLGLTDALLVALTGYGQDEDRRRSQEAGFNAHLVKPVDLDALHGLLARSPPAAPAQPDTRKN
jgi:PAS domain S-box-containing protein